MCVILNETNFNIDNVYFVENVKNNVKSNSYFSRIIYSTDFFSLKNIYLPINIQDMSFKDQYLKTTIYFNEEKSNLDYLYYLEEAILNKYIEYKTYNKPGCKIFPSYSIKNQCKLNFIKVFKNNNTNLDFFIKISGIWQTSDTIGITFKFV